MKFQNLTILIRHFPTIDELEDRVSTQIETPSILPMKDDTMLNQILQQLKSFSIKTGIKNIYCSDSNQCKETAELLNQNLEFNLVETPLLRNILRPKWEGLRNSEIRNKFPYEYDVWTNSPGNVKFEDGESLKDVSKRVQEFNEIYQEPKIVVTHTSTFQTFLLNNFSLSFNYAWDFKPEMFAFTVLHNGTLWCLNSLSLNIVTLDYK